MAQGCTQTKGVDYDQTFSLVIKYDSIRAVLSIAAQQAMYMIQFDIQTAFLNSLIDKVLYMHQPLGFEVQNSDGEKLVCLVLRSLYGFKQSRRIWNKTFNDFLLEFELEPTQADPKVYVSRTAPILIVTLFVDDGLACSVAQERLNQLMAYMECRFSTTRTSADLYVGLHIFQSADRQLIYVNQSIYLRRILLRFGFDGCKITSTPTDPNAQLDDAADPPEEVSFAYSAAVGCLMFAQTLTRRDISFAVSKVAQFSANP